MKRFRDADNEGNMEERKKIKFPFISKNKYEPLASLDAILRTVPEPYLFPEVSDYEQLLQDSKVLNLNLGIKMKEDLEEFMALAEEGPLEYSYSLIALGRDMLRLQQKSAKAHTQSEDYQDHSSESLRKDLTTEGCIIDVSDDDMKRRFRRVDFTAPFVLNLGPIIRKVATSRGQRLVGHVGDESKLLTLKMLKDNPEEHGLDKKVLDSFTDEHEIVDIEVDFRGKRKRLQAFKDGKSILIPCTEKNCNHEQLDFNNVSICSKRAWMGKKKLKTKLTAESNDEGGATPKHKPTATVTATSRCWDIDISNGEVVICEPAANIDPIVEIMEVDAPQITSVQSLAPNFTQTNLLPLASQLPNPVRRSRPSRALNRPQLLATQAIQAMCSLTPSRPTILSKTVTQTISNGATNIQPMPIILVPPNNNNKRKSNPNATDASPAACSFIPVSANPRPIPNQVLTASKLQKSLHAQGMGLKLGININNPASSMLTTPAVINKYPVSLVADNSAPLKIDTVYSTSNLPPLIPAPTKVSGNEVVVSTPKANEKEDLDTVTSNGEEPEVNSNGEESEITESGRSEDKEAEDQKTHELQVESSTNHSVGIAEETEEGSSPAPFNIAKNIFEEIDDEHDNEEEQEEGYNDFDIPQIVSTSGGVQMLTPETILVTGVNDDTDQHPTQYQSPMNEDQAKQTKIKQIRARLAAAKLKEKAEFPHQRNKGDKKFLVCRFCSKCFPHNALRTYRFHLRSAHKIKLQGFVDTPDTLNAVGRAGKVTSLSLLQQRKVVTTTSTTSVEVSTPIVKEWYKCKSCDQLLPEKDTKGHMEICCPNLSLDIAFDKVNMATGTKSTVPLLCGICDKLCETRLGLRQHLVSVHKEISSKVLLDPDLRCASCLARFQDSIHLTLHCQACVTRKASAETMLELAQGMLRCEICVENHESIHVTQDCYTKAGVIRCLICLHVVISRGNFFHHMKTYHFRNTVGICCPFCDIGEIPIRDCFVHILESHYNPILRYNTNLGGAGVAFDSSNRIIIRSEEQTKDFQRKLADANKALTASKLVMPTLRPANQRFASPAVVTPSSTQLRMVRALTPSPQARMVRALLPAPPIGGGQPRYVNLRTITPVPFGGRPNLNTTGGQNGPQTITIRAGQIMGGNPSGSPAGGIIRQVHIGKNHAFIRPIQFTNVGNALRQIRPMSPAAARMPTGLSCPPGGNLSGLRTLRPIRPAIAPAAGATQIQRGGTLHAITPAQLRPFSVLQGRPGTVPGMGVRVNFTNASSVNLLKK